MKRFERDGNSTILLQWLYETTDQKSTKLMTSAVGTEPIAVFGSVYGFRQPNRSLLLSVAAPAAKSKGDVPYMQSKTALGITEAAGE